MTRDLQAQEGPALPFDIRPLRPLPLPPEAGDPEAPWHSQPFPAVRAFLFAALGGYCSVPFSQWLAEAYFRGYWNAWPKRAQSYRRATRCRLRPLPGSEDTVRALLRLASAVLAAGPARRFPESGEARFLRTDAAADPGGPEPVFTVHAAAPEAVAALDTAAAAEAGPYAAWLYAEGMPRAMAGAAFDNDDAVRRLVAENCRPQEFYEKEREEKHE